ncbi:hypothetical protein HAX54_026813 [Datura stramonium]|uniref:Uncharacterized protein n=1 Tax=Datura stramonium TaxID=4076 RepID=A0ABS8S878_DATST|nr:hypothetical protein [Datura stramonium]
MIDGPSLAPSSNPEIMTPKFQPIRGGARRRSDRIDNMRHLRDENTNCEEEVQEVEINAPSSGYQTRSAASQKVANPPSDEGNDSSADGSSSSSDNPDSDKGSDNEAFSNPVEDTKPMRGDIIKGKMPGFRDSLCWQVKGAKITSKRVLIPQKEDISNLALRRK